MKKTVDVMEIQRLLDDRERKKSKGKNVFVSPLMVNYKK